MEVKVNLSVSNVAQHVQCTCAIPQSLTNVAPYLGKKKSLQGEREGKETIEETKSCCCLLKL